MMHDQSRVNYAIICRSYYVLSIKKQKKSITVTYPYRKDSMKYFQYFTSPHTLKIGH